MSVQKARVAGFRSIGGNAVLVLAAAIFALLLALNIGNANGWSDFDNVGEELAALIAMATCVTRVRREWAASEAANASRQDAWSWILIAAGCACWAIAQTYWALYSIILHSDPATPSPADIGFLASPLLVTAGLLTLVETPAKRLSQIRGMVEGLLIAAGVFLLSWVVVIGPTIGTDSGSTIEQAVLLAYPVLDAIALSAILFVWLRRRNHVPPGLGLLAFGMTSIAVADSAFWHLTTTTVGFPGVTPIGAGWAIGFVLVALAARSERPSRLGQVGEVPGQLLATIPIVPALLGVIVMLFAPLIGIDIGPSRPIEIALAAIVSLAMLLQLIAVYENGALLANLESRVAARTSELTQAEGYFRALVQNSTDIVTVIGPNSEIEYVSHSLRDIYGYAPRELVGMRLADLIHAGSADLIAAFELAVLRPGEIVPFTWQLKDLSGRPRSAESTITNLIDDPSVGGFVMNTRDATDRIQLEQQLSHKALHDDLTGIPNRALLRDRADRAIERALNNGGVSECALIKINGLARVNDELGHDVGDLVLVQMARRFEELMGFDDTVARVAANEFAVIVADTAAAEDGGLDLADRLRSTINAPMRLTEDAHEVTVGATIGVAATGPDCEDFVQLLRNAETALQVARAGDRESTSVFDPTMHEQASRRLKIQLDLRSALERDELELHYQPTFSVYSGRLIGFEALVRWRHPELGMVPPDEFIPFAEESGLIVPIGLWVFDEAVRQLAEWNANDTRRHLRVSVNVSTIQLSCESLVEDFDSVLKYRGVEADRVVIELTESTLLEKSEAGIERLRELSDLGMQVAIDDFGTGYASFSYLQRLPLDILKIDRSYVMSMQRGDENHELVKGMVALAKTLSLGTVAEGVEQSEQLEILSEIGCDVAQGYLLGKPMPADEASIVVATNRKSKSPTSNFPVTPTSARAA